MMIRLAILFSHPIQYFAPLIRHLAERPEIDLTVYYCSRFGVEAAVDPGFGKAIKWDVPLLEGYRYRFLSNSLGNPLGGFWSLVNPSIVGELLRERYHAIMVHGYALATNWMAIIAARVAGTAVLFRGETLLKPDQPFWLRGIKTLLLRTLFGSLVDGCLYIGTRAREFYEHYGVPSEKLFFTPYCVDNNFFREWARRLSTEREALRAWLGVSDHRPILLFVGKLIPKKQPLMLLRAYAEVRRRHCCALVYVGEGEMRATLEATAHQESIPDVYITGFMNQTEIPRAYAAADLLVLPSSYNETWGLVINEGMNFGLPVVVTDQVGCSIDLVEPGKNGYIVPWNDLAALSGAIESLVANPEKRMEFGRRSLEIVDEWSLERCVDGIVWAVQTVVTRKRQ